MKGPISVACRRIHGILEADENNAAHADQGARDGRKGVVRQRRIPWIWGFFGSDRRLNGIDKAMPKKPERMNSIADGEHRRVINAVCKELAETIKDDIGELSSNGERTSAHLRKFMPAKIRNLRDGLYARKCLIHGRAVLDVPDAPHWSSEMIESAPDHFTLSGIVARCELANSRDQNVIGGITYLNIWFHLVPVKGYVCYCLPVAPRYRGVHQHLRFIRLTPNSIGSVDAKENIFSHLAQWPLINVGPSSRVPFLDINRPQLLVQPIGTASAQCAATKVVQYHLSRSLPSNSNSIFSQEPEEASFRTTHLWTFGDRVFTQTEMRKALNRGDMARISY
ncbi:hypothetical protein K438DRAFT_1784096 [Mycena galopus ATCC 62051]|nr:hypothetical protein K438DRAFT_1784096 [Mycena galopus ATCC 62051]